MMNSKWFWTLVLVVLALVLAGLACASSSDEGREVSKEGFGEDWPFTVERGFIDCTKLPGGLREAVFRSGSVTYALNGTARSRAEAQGYEDIMESSIWRDDSTIPGLKIDIGPILNLALQECD